jgi:ABC-type spermidine/putrescine transport system, permease component II
MLRTSPLIDRAKALLPALPVLAFLVYFFGLPVLKILEGALYTPEAGFGLEQFRKITGNVVYAKVLSTTFVISFLTALISVVFGYPVAYFLSQLEIQSRARWVVWLLVPFWTSYLVKTFAWILILSRSGVLGNLTVGLGITKNPVSLVPSLAAVLICMVHGMLPLAVMTMLPIMQGINKQLTQAAETLGADRISSFFTVFLPLSAPGVAAGGLLVFITSLGFFITPALLGTPKETMVAQLVISAVLDLLNLPLAGALSVPLLVCAILVFIAYDRLAGLSSLSGEANTRRSDRLSAAFGAVLFSVGGVFSRLYYSAKRAAAPLAVETDLKSYVIVVFALLLIPIAVVIPISFTSSSFLAFPPTGFSLKWFKAFLVSPVWQAATIRSFLVATTTATFALVLGFGATLSMTRLPAKWAKSVFAFLIAPLIVPRIVIAVGLFYLYARLQLTGTNAGLVIGHTVLAIPYVVVTMSAAMKRFDWRLDDAARILGASAWKRLWTILLPLLLPGLIASFLFAFITSLDELTIAIFVSGGLKTTLPKQMWDEVQLSINPTLAAVSTMLVVVISISLILPVLLRRTTTRKIKEIGS